MKNKVNLAYNSLGVNVEYRPATNYSGSFLVASCDNFRTKDPKEPVTGRPVKVKTSFRYDLSLDQLYLLAAENLVDAVRAENPGASWIDNLNRAYYSGTDKGYFFIFYAAADQISKGAENE